jgi:ribosomal protein S18 acetylase RimI-like enzyme
MLIRRLLPEDAASFQAVRLRGLLEIPSAFTSSHAEEVDTPLEVTAETLAQKPDGAVFGAFADGTLAGVLGIQQEGHRQVAHKAFIWGMYVAPEHRRNGLGRALIAHALKFAAQDLRVRSVNLGVNTANRAAVALYEAMGFRTYGTEPGFLMIDGVLHDEHLMSVVIQRKVERTRAAQGTISARERVTHSIRVADPADTATRDAIRGPLGAYNNERTGREGPRPLVLVLDNPDGRTIGGLWARTVYGWLIVELLFVPEALRGKGAGHDLMALAEREAISRGCHSAWLDTFEFQARGFYERLGYTAFAKLPDNPSGFSRCFMKKPLV